MTAWSLQHAWTLPSDMTSLDICRRALAEVGVCFESGPPQQAPCAIKMHGLELLDAIRSDPSRLHEMSAAAADAHWTWRLPSFVQHYMRSDAHWYGIPMGIHQSNMFWVNRDIEQTFGAAPADNLHDFVAWMRQLQRTLRHPLALGAEPWQVGILLESITLAVAGPELYRQAFAHLDPNAWLHPRMVESLELMASLRPLVDESAWYLPWRAQLQRLEHGQAAVQFMGDWVRSQPLTKVRGGAVPGTTLFFVAINDFFVPLVHETPALQDLVGTTLTASSIQSLYARQKGCMPCVHDSWEEVDPSRATLLQQPTSVLPSFVFDQCGALDAKNALLQSLAQWFIQGGQATDEALRMKNICSLFRKSEGLP